jgi:hypothetical protein
LLIEFKETHYYKRHYKGEGMQSFQNFPGPHSAGTSMCSAIQKLSNPVLLDIYGDFTA